jgi:hypothetical protein
LTKGLNLSLSSLSFPELAKCELIMIHQHSIEL